MAQKTKGSEVVSFSDLKDFEKEIIYNIVNSLLAGGLVFIGGLSATGCLSWQTVAAATLASAAVALTKFKEYWTENGDIFRKPPNKKAQLFSFF